MLDQPVFLPRHSTHQLMLAISFATDFLAQGMTLPGAMPRAAFLAQLKGALASRAGDGMSRGLPPLDQCDA